MTPRIKIIDHSGHQRYPIWGHIWVKAGPKEGQKWVTKSVGAWIWLFAGFDGSEGSGGQVV